MRSPYLIVAVLIVTGTVILAASVLMPFDYLATLATRGVGAGMFVVSAIASFVFWINGRKS